MLTQNKKKWHSSLPGNGVESPSENGGSYVTSRSRHTGYSRPVVCSDVVDFDRVEMWNTIKPSNHINVVIEQSHTSPWKQQEGVTTQRFSYQPKPKNSCFVSYPYRKTLDQRIPNIWSHLFLTYLTAWWPWVWHWSSGPCVGHTAPQNSKCSAHHIHLWGRVWEGRHGQKNNHNEFVYTVVWQVLTKNYVISHFDITCWVVKSRLLRLKLCVLALCILTLIVQQLDRPTQSHTRLCHSNKHHAPFNLHAKIVNEAMNWWGKSLLRSQSRKAVSTPFCTAGPCFCKASLSDSEATVHLLYWVYDSKLKWLQTGSLSCPREKRLFSWLNVTWPEFVLESHTVRIKWSHLQE